MFTFRIRCSPRMFASPYPRGHCSGLQEGCNSSRGFHLIRADSLREVLLIIASQTHWSVADLKAMTPNELEFWAEGLADLQSKADARRETSRRR